MIPGEKTWSLAARCVYSAEEPNTVIIFEDLSPLGYQMYCRQEGYDLEHCLLVVKKLARLHAASVVLHEQVTAIFFYLTLKKKRYRQKIVFNYLFSIFCHLVFIIRSFPWSQKFLEFLRKKRKRSENQISKWNLLKCLENNLNSFQIRGIKKTLEKT